MKEGRTVIAEEEILKSSELFKPRIKCKEFISHR